MCLASCAFKGFSSTWSTPRIVGVFRCSADVNVLRCLGSVPSQAAHAHLRCIRWCWEGLRALLGWRRPWDVGVSGHMWHMIAYFFSVTLCQVRVGTSSSEPWVDSGITQGPTLSFALWSVCSYSCDFPTKRRSWCPFVAVRCLLTCWSALRRRCGSLGWIASWIASRSRWESRLELSLASSLVNLFCLEWDAGEDDRPFVSDCNLLCPEARESWLKLYESPLEHCPCAFHCKHSPTFLSTWALFPFWLLVTEHLTITSFPTLKLWFSHHLINMKFHCRFRWFDSSVSHRFRATSWSCKCAITVRSWAESCNFDLYNPSRIGSEGISLSDKSARSQSYIEILSIVILQSHANQVCEFLHHGNTWRPCSELGFLERIFDTFSFSEDWLRVDELLQGGRNHRIKHIEIRKMLLPCNRSRCNKFVNWFSYLNFFDPQHEDLRFGCSHTNFSSETFSFEFP